jgi:hypothetical protein
MEKLERRMLFAKVIIIGLVFGAPLSALSLPRVILPGPQAVDATSLQTPSYGESRVALIQGENNWTQWRLNSAQNNASLNTSNGLVLTGELPPSPNPSAISMSRTLVVNLTEYPIVYMLVNVSTGVSYGIRFFSSASGGAVVPLWSDNDVLDHRLGTGRLDGFQINMLQMIEENTGKIFNALGGVTVYVERGPSSQSTDFSFQIEKFEFLDYPLVPARSVGSYHAIYIGLNQLQQNPSLMLRSVQIQGRLNASKGAVFVPYFIQGLSVYPGSVYTFTTGPVEVSLIITLGAPTANPFSDKLPIETSALVMIAASGTLTQLVVQNISLNYYSRTAQAFSAPSQDRGIFVNDAFFIVLLPASIIILILGELRKRKRVEPNP